MLRGKRIVVRPMRDEDVPVVAAWAADPAKASGDFQRFQLEHGRLLTGMYAQGGLIGRDSGFMIVELVAQRKQIGFVRYNTGQFPDPDIASVDIGYGIAEPEHRGKGYATESVALLLDYLFSGYVVERVSAFTDAENTASRRLLEHLGFVCEGTMRSATFRQGAWRDMCIYGILRREWAAKKEETA